LEDKIYHTVVKENDQGELYIDIPQEILSHLNWDESTLLELVVEEDGKFTLKRIQE